MGVCWLWTRVGSKVGGRVVVSRVESSGKVDFGVAVSKYKGPKRPHKDPTNHGSLGPPSIGEVYV